MLITEPTRLTLPLGSRKPHHAMPEIVVDDDATLSIKFPC